MIWLFAILIVIIMGAVAMVAAGRGEPMSTAYDDRPDTLVPADRALSGDDLQRVRFSLAFRGYRMSEVDALLERLAGQLRNGAPGDGSHDGSHDGSREGSQAEGSVDGSGEGPAGLAAGRAERSSALADSGDDAAL